MGSAVCLREGSKVHVVRQWPPAFVTGCSDRSVRIWDHATGRCLQTFQGHRAAVWSAAFSSDGTKLVTSARDRTARIWDVQTGECLQVLEGHQGPVWAACFS